MTATSSSVPNPDTIRRVLGEFQLAVSDLQVSQIQQYMRMLLAWNDKVNLTAIRDPLEMLYRHFGESMYAVNAVPIKNGRLADIGSGGGFPGLPIRIMEPDVELLSVESNFKKATFLAEVVREIGLSNARVLVSRYEELAEELTPLDFVCSRAVGEFEPLLDWAHSAQIAVPQIVLWVGGRDLEQIKGIAGWKWREPLSIPHSLRRFVLVGDRVEMASGTD
jgi:16S rRNA (guanine527-N7)-methyltransferase